MRNRDRSTIRRYVLALVAGVLLMLPVCLPAAGTRGENANPSPATGAVQQQEPDSNRPASAGLVALGFGLAWTARRLKRRNS